MICIHFRNTVVDFQNYLTANSKHKSTEEYKQSCINFHKSVEKHYKDHENSEFAFCYKLFLQQDLCYSPEKIDCFIEVLNQILEQLEERINQRLWLWVKIFGLSNKKS